MRIFVDNLHINVSEIMLHNLFNSYGEVLSVSVAVDKTGRPKGYGYVVMKEYTHGHTAIDKLNKMNLMNQFLEVYELG